MATADVENVTLDQARRIIHEFLVQAARCPVCEGTGTFTFTHDTVVQEDHGHGKPPTMTVKAGSVISCPRCGGAGETLGRDLRHVVWHCLSEEAVQYCQDNRDEERRRAAHRGCGWRLVLPIEPESLQPEGRER